MSISEQVMALVARVAETDEVGRNPDLPLYESDILDSMKTVDLIVSLEESFGIEISPAELDREQWATPRKIVAYMEQRVAQ
jgi:D-alanine--poly(phosphoribitol) ligase subunit 2